MDKNVIKDIAHGDHSADNKSIIKHCCEKEDIYVIKLNVSAEMNYEPFNYTDKESVCVEKCKSISSFFTKAARYLPSFLRKCYFVYISTFVMLNSSSSVEFTRYYYTRL